MAHTGIEGSNNKGPQGYYEPLYPHHQGKALTHTEMDYNLDLIGEIIKGFRVMGTGPDAEMHLTDDIDKVLKLYKVQSSDATLIAEGADVGDFVWVTGVATGGGGGAQGYQGSLGPQGDIGAQGSIGNQGSGTQGEQGITGDQGEVGPQGDIGAQGSIGNQGSGAQGEQGAQGIPGNQGDEGIQGDQGATGDAGPQGNKVNRVYQELKEIQENKVYLV